MFASIQKKKADLFSLKDDQFEGKIKLIVQQNHFLVNELEYQTRQTENLEFKNDKLRVNLQSLKNEIEIHKNMEMELGKRAMYLRKLQLDFAQKNAVYKQKLDKINEKRDRLVEERNKLLALKDNKERYETQKQQRLNELQAQEAAKAEIAALISEVDAEIGSLRREYVKRHNAAVLVHYVLKQLKERILQFAVYNNKLADTKNLVTYLKGPNAPFVQKKAYVHLGKFRGDFKRNM